jgi:agmatine deiminase
MTANGATRKPPQAARSERQGEAAQHAEGERSQSGLPSEVQLAGYRWPAEWEPHAATWLSWPHNPETWPGRLPEVEAAFVEMVRALAGRETVRIDVANESMADGVARRLRAGGVETSRGVELHLFPTNDAWVRDHGPVFVTRGRERAVVDFGYDAWGGKYPPWHLDDAIPRQVAAALGLPRYEAGFVLEGGSIDGDGRGSVLTTESCLLNPNRERGRTREGMERRLAHFLGARHVIWLGDGVEGDDTDGHVDDLARFVAPGVVVAAVEADAGDANHAPLADNLRRLRAARDADGKPLTVATLPMPPRLDAGGLRCPASYANFYVANGVVLVPVFGARSDRRALAVLAELFPGRDIVGIPSQDLVAGLGAVHCLTCQEPAPGTP